MAATRTRFASDGERRLYQALARVYGPRSVQGHVSMGNVVSGETLGLSDEELRYLRLAHFDFVIWDTKEQAMAAWEFDGVHHFTVPEQQRRDSLKDNICHKAELPLYRISGRPSAGTIRRMTKPWDDDRASLRARRLVGVLGAGLGNGLGLILWWQAGEYVRPWVSQLCLWPLVIAAIGPLLSYVTIMLVKGRYNVSAMRVLPMQVLNGMLFLLTTLLLIIGSYLGWTADGGVTLLDVSLWLPYMLLAPVIIGTYLAGTFPRSEGSGLLHVDWVLG
jgi:hypothetical protein